MNYLLKDVIEGKVEGRIEVTGRRGRRRNQLLGDLKETRGYRKLKEEVLLDRTLLEEAMACCKTDYMTMMMMMMTTTTTTT
jgi:hypothetical protein